MKQIVLLLFIFTLSACNKGGEPQALSTPVPFKSYTDGTFRVSWGTQTFNEAGTDFTVQVDQGSAKFLCFMNLTGSAYMIDDCDVIFTESGTYMLTETELVLCQGSNCKVLTRDYSWTKE